MKLCELRKEPYTMTELYKIVEEILCCSTKAPGKF